ncbi:MAG TPA: tetratricopeptide repeat protein [Longimicrobiaceae bacterium]|jgi:tetratricopeptide (TPR) repeat protein
MALAVVERNALLEQAWSLLAARDYVAIVELLADLPLDEHVREPELGVILCSAWFQVGELDRSLVLVQQLTDVCERRGNTWLSRRRLNCEGLIRVTRVELDAAEPLLQEVLARAESAGDGQMVTWVHNNLGILYTSRGSWDFALSHYRRGIAAGQRIGDVRHLSLCHMNMSTAYFRTDRLSDAQEHIQQALDLARESASEAEIAHIECSHANILLAGGDISLAKAVLERARNRFSALNSTKGLAIVEHVSGRLLMHQGHSAEARDALKKALKISEETGYKELSGFILESLAVLHGEVGEVDAAKEYFARAIGFFSRLGNTYELDRLRSRSRVYLQHGE